MTLREFYETIASTQERAIAWARTGAPAGARVVAGRQTDGRGRSDRRWYSPAGGLYLSVVAGPPPRHAGLVALAVGASLAGAIDERWAAGVLLKWPNDLFVRDVRLGGRKLGGILIDRVAGHGDAPVDVVGVGLNGRNPDGGWPAEWAVPPIALEEAAREPVDLGELESVAAGAVGTAHSLLDRDDGGPTAVALARERLYGVGHRVLADGRPVGRLIGLSDDGALRVAGPNGTVDLLAGDVAVVSEAA